MKHYAKTCTIVRLVSPQIRGKLTLCGDALVSFDETGVYGWTPVRTRPVY